MFWTFGATIYAIFWLGLKPWDSGIEHKLLKLVALIALDLATFACFCCLCAFWETCTDIVLYVNRKLFAI